MEILIVVALLLIAVAFFWSRRKGRGIPAVDELDDLDDGRVVPGSRQASASKAVESPPAAAKRGGAVDGPAPAPDQHGESRASDATPSATPSSSPGGHAAEVAANPAHDLLPAHPVAPEINFQPDPVQGLPSIAPVEAVPPPPDRSKEGPKTTSHVDYQSLRRGLAKSRQDEGFFGRLRALLGGKKQIDPKISEEIEELLLTSDVGVKTTERLLASLKERLARGELSNEDRVWEALSAEACRIVDVEGRSGALTSLGLPTVVLFVGVNGAGKTTTIGKLAKQLKSQGKTVMLAAGDTFRAAAVEQLRAWGERTSCEVIFGKEGADPSSVLFDAVTKASEAGVDFLLADTAGRLHTKTNLMQEMTKIAKTLGKALPGAPHETLLVIDSTNGQNAMAQAREFREALPLTGLVLTKLDGTARGGVVLGICDTLKVPVRYVGLGERTEDLQEFGAAEFVEALLGRDDTAISA